MTPMMKESFVRTVVLGCAVLFFIFANEARGTDDATVTREQLLLLQKQNAQMQEQLQKQKELIDSLSRKVADIQESAAHNQTNLPGDPTSAITPAAAANPSADASFKIANVAISGEGSVDFFKSQSRGQNPNGAFRVNEARLFLDAPIWNDVYFYSEIDFATRESTSLALNVGELYVDFEDVSQLWGRDRMLNVRAGQFYTPFGEEYL